MQLSRNKIRQINGLADAGYLGAFTAAATYAKFLIEKGGIYTLPLMPILELTKAWLYWSKEHQDSKLEHQDSKLKIRFNHALNALKVIASATAVSLALAGMMPIGFSILIISGYVSTARALTKVIRSAILREKNYQHKVANNLHKAVVGGLISTGFLFMSFFPPLAPVGVLFVLITAGHLILSSLPSMIANTPLKDKNDTPVKPLLNEPKPVKISRVGFTNMLRHSVPVEKSKGPAVVNVKISGARSCL
jgi:hypothetical protein